MGPEDFKPQNEMADKMEALNFDANLKVLQGWGLKTYPDDFNKQLKEKNPDLYERALGLGGRSSEMEIGKAVDDLNAALEAPAAKPKMTREKFMEANKDLDVKQFYTLDGQKMTFDFKGNKNAEQFVQIQDVMKDPAENKQMQLEKKGVVYTWDESKNPPSFYSGDYRMRIVTGDVVTIQDKAEAKTPETPENAKMRESLAAKFGVDATKLTDLKMTTDGGEAKATYNYEQNGQKYVLQFNTGKNEVTIMDANGKVVDSATAGKSKDESGNIQVAMVIEDLQKDQGVDTKGRIAEAGTEKIVAGVEMNATAIKAKFNLKEDPTDIMDGGLLLGMKGIVQFKYRDKIVVLAPNGGAAVLDNLQIINPSIKKSKDGLKSIAITASVDSDELDKGETIDSIVDKMIKKDEAAKKTAEA